MRIGSSMEATSGAGTGRTRVIVNQRATFVNPVTKLRIENAGVQIYYASGDARLDPYAASYRWAVKYPSALTYADGQRIQRDHQIVWAGLDEPGNRAPLKRPRESYGVLPFCTAYFQEMSP